MANELSDWKIELYRPFALEEHRFTGKTDNDDAGNVYLMKGPIERRLDRVVKLDWSMGRPELVSVTNDLVVMTAALIVMGQAQWGLGTGKIQRVRAEYANGQKTGKTYEIDALALAQETSKAFKGAALDCLPRAAYLHGIGWYMRDIPASWKKRIGARVGFAEYLDTCNEQFTRAHGDPSLAKSQMRESEPTKIVDFGGGGKPSPHPQAQPPPPMPDPATGEKAVIPANALYLKIESLFRDREHFDHSYEKHMHELAGMTMNDAIAFYKKLHWNYDKALVNTVTEVASGYGLKGAQILAAFSKANGHTVKSWREWDGGDTTYALGALLAFAADYDSARLVALIKDKQIDAAIANVALDYLEKVS